MVAPLARAKIFIDPHSARSSGARSKVGENKSEMPGFRDDGVMTISSALTIATGMDVNIGYNSQVRVTAYLPYDAKFASVKFNDSIREAVRINVVVIKELVDTTHPPLNSSEKKSAAFAMSSGAASKFVDAPVPDTRIARKLRRRSDCLAPKRLK
jgi:hypothetical protein